MRFEKVVPNSNTVQSLQIVEVAGYISPNEKLPEQLGALRDELENVLEELNLEAGGKLQSRFEDPDANGGVLARELN